MASCHSEFVGRIFLEAGVKHVICIDHNFEVEDDAVMTFTDAFYDAVFSNKMCICQAFYNAQLVVSISNSTEQADIFKLLVRDYMLDENPQLSTSRSARTARTATPAHSMAGSEIRSNLTFGGETSNSHGSGSTKESPNVQTSRSSFSGRGFRRESLRQRTVFTQGRKKHYCRTFGKFPKGIYNEVDNNEPALQIGSIEQPVFVGRQKDTFKLI